jgi:hypothetical protein
LFNGSILLKVPGSGSKDFYISAYNNGYGASTHSQKIHGYKFYLDGVLARDYVPILDPSGVACMYDRANKEYCYNAGSGAFIPGYKIPKGYTERERITSSGTQWLDTGYKPNNNTRVVIDCKANAISSGGSFPLGARGAAGSGTNGFDIAIMPTYVFFKYGTKYQTANYSNVYERMVIDANKNTATFTGSQTVTATVATSTFSVQYNLILFAFNDSGSINTGSAWNGDVYLCQIYEGATPVRDYVPVTDANGVACAFDRIGNKTYYNAGSGSFIAGAAVETPKEEPEETPESSAATVEGETADGKSLVDRYLILSGDANACIEYILNRIGLPSALFVPSADESGVMISKYQFARYVDAYTGLCDMLASVGMRLQIVHEDGVVMLSAVAAIDYSQTQEFEAALIPYETKKYLNKPNHLVCLGSGELENRIVVHLYMDADGNISETPTFSALDDYTAVYDYPNAASGEDVTEEEQRQELIASGTERFKELQTPDTIDIDFDITEDAYYIGDIIGTYDQETGLFVSALIYKKIMTLKNGLVNVYYNEG